ncbi:MAG TPA: tyrosine-protein phosphatase [Blastocatellia bacterium]|nr:tyrosine-protein phosphatase [Blastocatellia bacterium]
MKRVVFSQRSLRTVVAVILTCSLLPAVFAGNGSGHRATRGGVSVDNFGQVNDHLYRGGQPKGDQYHQLAALGVKTIVDLRAEGRGDEKEEAGRAGLHYISLPLEDKSYPQADAARHFLEIVNDKANWPVYVHCAGGRHRTGSMVAIYRMEVDHWTVEQAYAEMKRYDFYRSSGHGCYKDYVYAYYRDLQARNQAQPAADTPGKVVAKK